MNVALHTMAADFTEEHNRLDLFDLVLDGQEAGSLGDFGGELGIEGPHVLAFVAAIEAVVAGAVNGFVVDNGQIVLLVAGCAGDGHW